LDEGGEGGVDLAFDAGLQDSELYPLRTGRFLHVSDYGLGIRTVRVYQQSDHAGLGSQLEKQIEQLGRQPGGGVAEPRQVAAWPGETGDTADPDRIADGGDDRDHREVALFAASAGGVPPFVGHLQTIALRLVVNELAQALWPGLIKLDSVDDNPESCSTKLNPSPQPYKA
jgi:hypothetical protein